MIVVDTTVLAYSIGTEHPLREPCRRLLGAVRHGLVEATTTLEVIQELAHIRGRREPRHDAANHARAFARFLTPLLRPRTEDLDQGLSLFEDHPRLGAFDAVLAATALGRGAEALVSADRAFGGIPGLTHLIPDSPEVAGLWADGAGSVKG